MTPYSRMPTSVLTMSAAILFLTMSSMASSVVRAESAASATAMTSESKETGVRSSLRDLLRSWLPSTDTDDESVGGETAEAEGGTPEALEGNVVAPIDILSKEDLAHALPWRPTSFDNQKGALGWSPNTFDVPDAFRTRVNFWKDIYSKYSTDQGVIHDTLYINIIYTSMDFSAISRDSSKTSSQKARAREALVKDKKKEIIARLQRLQGHKSADGLTGDDLKTWRLFERINDPAKFADAADKSRVRFQLGQRDKFVLGIFYSGRYLRAMEKIFRDEGLPMELTRLPFVESSFNVNARSRVGASGVWQFMRRTAKPYMKVNKDLDERNDPIKATLASSRVLKQNYMMLDSWPLALTGYNHGPYGVRGIVAKTHTRDLAEIIARYSSRTFGFASENFYACFLAALEIEKDARKYFGDVKWSNEIASSEVKVASNTPYRTLLDLFEGNSVFAEQLNPQFSSRVRSGHAPIPKGAFIRVPPARAEIAFQAMNGKLSGAKLAAAIKQTPSILESHSSLTAATLVAAPTGGMAVGGMQPSIRAKVEQTGQAAQAVLPILTLANGDPSTASKLTEGSKPSAVELGAGVNLGKSEPSRARSETQAAEPIHNKTEAGIAKNGDASLGEVPVKNSQAEVPQPVLQPGRQTVPLQPTGDPMAAALESSIKSEAVPPTVVAAIVKPRTHKVRRGENLSHIARKYGIDIDDLERANHLVSAHRKNLNQIRVGQILLIPWPGSATDAHEIKEANAAITPRADASANSSGHSDTDAVGLQTPSQAAPQAIPLAAPGAVDAKSLPGAEPSPPMR